MLCNGLNLRWTSSARVRVALLLGAGLVLSLALVKPARAADLGGGPNRYEPVAPRTQIERWTGFYLGASLGGSFGATDVAGDFGSGVIDSKGYSGGILAGYNWQMGRMVVGLETDLSAMSLSGSRSNGFDRYTFDIDAVGSLRARAGFLLSPSMLVYATGGYAWARSDVHLDGGERAKQTLTGWQAGVGTELMLNQKWTMRLEYLYTDLGDKGVTLSGNSNAFDTQFHTVRAGLTFRF